MCIGKNRKLENILSKLEGTIKVDCLNETKLILEENGVLNIMPTRKVKQLSTN